MTIDLKGKFERLTFAKGQVILEEGEVGDAVYIIVDGRVEIRAGKVATNPRMLAIRGRGDVIGEMALFDDKPHMASAVAVDDTVVNAMPRDEFKRRLESMDPLMRGIMKMIVDRMRQVIDDLMRAPEVNWADWRRKD